MHNIQQYSSSESDSGENESPQNESITKLPSSMQILGMTTPDESALENDSSKHQGRIRSFAHERGIWASYVFVDYDEIDPMHDLQQQIIDRAAKDLNLELNQVGKLHLSLTKTFVLRHHNITGFVNSVRAATKQTKRFTVLLSELAIYVNEEETRTFLGIKVHGNSYGPLNQLVEKLDFCMKNYKLPEFYVDPSYHVSILWTLGNQRKLLEDNLPVLQQIFSAIYEEEYCDMNVNVRQLYFKCGNKFYDFNLL